MVKSLFKQNDEILIVYIDTAAKLQFHDVKSLLNHDGLINQFYFQIFDKALLRTIFEAQIKNIWQK